MESENITVGPFELMRSGRGELALAGARGVGTLSYSGQNARHGSFRLFMPLPSRYGCFVNACDFTDISAQNTRDGLTVTHQKPIIDGVEYDIRVVQQVHLGAGLDSLELIVSVQNDCPYLIKEIWVTGFEGLTRLNGTDRINLRHARYSFDDLLRSPLNRGWEFYTPGRDCFMLTHGFASPMHFAIFDAGDASLYVGSHDEHKRAGAHMIVRYPGRNASGYLPSRIEPEMSCFYIYRVRLASGEKTTVGKLVLSIAAGDWHAFRDIYRRWHLEHFPLCPRNAYFDRYDGWQHKALVLNDGSIWNHFKELPQLYRQLNKTTGLTCLMIYGHTEEGADLSEPDVEPAGKAGGLSAFQEALAEIHAMGGKVFIMTKANRASLRAPEWEKQWRKSVIMDERGREYYSAWQIECGWESGLQGRINGGMCLFDRNWQTFIAARLSRLAQIGVDGIQLDEICDRKVCHHTGHDHQDPAVEFFCGLGQTLERIGQECRKLKPDIIIGGEEISDSDFHWLEFSFSRWSCQNSDAGVTPGRVFRYYLPEAITHTRVQSFEIDQINYALLLGTPIDLEVNGLRSMIYEHPFELAHVQNMLGVRRKHGRFFYQGTYMDTQHFKVRSDKVVHYGSHRARNGDDLLIVINRLDNDALVRIETDRSCESFHVWTGYNAPTNAVQTLDQEYPVRAHDILIVECFAASR